MGDPSLSPGPGRSAGEGIGYPLQYSWASLVAQLVRNLPAIFETWVRSLSWKDHLELCTPVFWPGMENSMNCIGHWVAKSWTWLSDFHSLIYIPTYIYIYIWYIYGEGNGTPLQYSCLENPMDEGAWKAAVHEVAKSRTWLNNFTLTFHFHALEKEMATHSSVLAWRIPGTGEPGGLPSLGSHRVRHDWSDLAAAAAAWYTYIYVCVCVCVCVWITLLYTWSNTTL